LFSSIDPLANAPDRASLDAWIDCVYREHSAAIYGMALRSTRDPEAAADVTQEVFIRLFTEARAGRRPDNARAWLYRASANLVVSRARRATVAHRYAPLLLRRDTPAEPETISIEREENAAIARAIATLPALERIALVMAAQGASGSEIADHLGRSHGATRTMMSRARRRVRAVMTATSVVEAAPTGVIPFVGARLEGGPEVVAAIPAARTADRTRSGASAMAVARSSAASS
jgi:RNA polymerase sigma-70 factor, ECF subfamily